jgi:hypothetical protein
MDFKEKLKEKFDYDTEGIGSYVNEQSEDIYTQLLYSSGLTSRIQVMENVKGSEKIKLLNVEFELQNADGCKLDSDGTVIFTDKTITTQRVGVQFSLCNDNLNGTWAQMLLAIGANRQDEEMPMEDVITAFVVKSSKKKNQDLMFNGDTTLIGTDLRFYDGFLKLWDADPDINVAERVGTLEITTANAYQNAMSVYNAIPEEAFDNEFPMEIIMSRKNAQLIISQIWNDKDFNAKIEKTDEGGELSFELPTTNITVRSYPQLKDSEEMYAIPYHLMFFGTDVESDLDGYKVKFLEDAEELQFGNKFRTAVQYVLPRYFVKLNKHLPS